MTDKDQDIWALYAKGVRRLDEKPEEKPAVKKKPASPPAPEPEPFPAAWTKGAVSPPPTPEPPPAPPKPEVKVWKREPLDLRIERNLSLGDVVIEARLDLHGATESVAHEKLQAFIETQRARGKRLVLVITGKGGEGVLRTNVPRWCDVPPLDSQIMAVRSAAPHHGGEGAYYLLLRKTER